MDSAHQLMILMAAWLLLAVMALWSKLLSLDLEKSMLWASLRGPIQLVALAFILQSLFEIHSHWVQLSCITFFCAMAALNSSGHGKHSSIKRAYLWLSIFIALMTACAISLPWLVFTGAIEDQSRVLIPVASMIAANSMNSVSVMLHTMGKNDSLQHGLHNALIPAIDSLKTVGLVHMPGVFVGMVLAGAPPLQAASTQLIILYMIVASSFAACIISFFMISYFRKIQA
ncbi:MAG: ABC transporter permease [Mariprofundaceae bacterium]